MEIWREGWNRKGRVWKGVDIAPSTQLGLPQPPGVKEQRLVSWSQSQLISSIVCSGHPLGQQRRRHERPVWGAAAEQGLLFRYLVQGQECQDTWWEVVLGSSSCPLLG